MLIEGILKEKKKSVGMTWYPMSTGNKWLPHVVKLCLADLSPSIDDNSLRPNNYGGGDNMLHTD